MQEKLIDKKFTEDYINIMKQQEQAKREKREDIKRLVDNQQAIIPSGREK